MYTYDPATDRGKVRLYIDDRDVSSVAPTTPLDQRSAIFEDAELDMLLAAHGGVLRASAAALRIIAANRTLLVRSRKVGDTSVDYGDAADRLMKLATEYESKADKEEGGDESPADAIVEQGWSDFAERRIVTNAWSRRP
jgi:hypothetical protein